MAVETLKKRADFLKLRGGARCATPCFVLETRPRAVGSEPLMSEQTPSGRAPEAAVSGARFGFTVTKKLGGAVVRNRIRRRLREAVGLVAPALAHANHDYVLIARGPAFDRAFSEIKKDLERALQRVHHPAAHGAKGRVR